MKKKFFLSALLISLFSLAAAKPVQADTSVADIQKRGELVVGVKQDVPNFGYKDPKTGTYSGIETDLAKMIAEGQDSLRSCYRSNPRTTIRQRTGRHGYRNFHHHRRT